MSLAVAMQAAPGRFALLLGSGVSISAGIPTGWAVVSDLARRLAVAHGEEAPAGDPIEWFVERHQQMPGYSDLIETLAPTAAQRRDLLAGYFEPTAEEREAGAKAPTRAHRAIGSMVARGIVRVIVTTNFDRLLEQAIQSEGLEPVVVATPEAAAGSIPLAHTRCTIVKVHGDYLDPNIKNTIGELDSYDPATDALLDRVFDDYGLVVCGWSATWDRALRAAIERCPTRRYGTYWAARSDPSPEADRLITHRDATIMPIDDADSFFETLNERIEALDDLARRSTTGVDLVAAQAKRYLPDPVHRIRLHDLVMDADQQALNEIDFDGHPPNNAMQDFVDKMARIEAASSDLVALHAVLGTFGNTDDHRSLIRRSIERLAGPTRVMLSGYTAWINLRGYPALLAIYSAGIGSITGENWNALPTLLTARSIDPSGGTEELHPVADLLRPYRVLDDRAANRALGGGNRRHPVADYLHRRLALMLRPVLRLTDDEFTDAFDEWEYLHGVVAHHIGGHGPVGRWAAHDTHHRNGRVPTRALDASTPQLLDAGLFDGAVDQLTAVRESYHTMIEQDGTRWIG